MCEVPAARHQAGEGLVVQVGDTELCVPRVVVATGEQNVPCVPALAAGVPASGFLFGFPTTRPRLPTRFRSPHGLSP